jgi:hypothetical protein
LQGCYCRAEDQRSASARSRFTAADTHIATSSCALTTRYTHRASSAARHITSRHADVTARTAAAANAVKYAAEYAKEDQDLIDNKRAAKKAGNFFVEGEAKIAFVIRTRG